MKKLKRHVRGLVFVLVFGILCTSNFLVNAKSETVSFSVFDKNAMRFVTQRMDGSFFTNETVGGNTITRLANATRFTNGAEFYTTSQDDTIACLWVFTDPTAVDSPVYSLVGYKGCTVNFSVTYTVTPRSYDSSGNYIADGTTFEFLKDSNSVAKYFAFYSRPDWTVYTDSNATAKKVHLFLSNYKRTAQIVVEYSFTIPSDTFNIYGFTSSVGRPNDSGSLDLDEKWKLGVNRAYYGFSATFSDITVESLTAADKDYASPATTPNIEPAVDDMGTIDQNMTDYTKQANDYLTNGASNLSSYIKTINHPWTRAFTFITEMFNKVIKFEPLQIILLMSSIIGLMGLLFAGWQLPVSQSKVDRVADAAYRRGYDRGYSVGNERSYRDSADIRRR